MTIYSLLRFWGVDLHFVKMLIALSSVFDMIGLSLGNLLYRKISMLSWILLKLISCR